MNYSFEDYENAILDALSPLKAQNGGYLRILKGYVAEFESEESFKYFLGLTPGVLVEIEGAKYSQNGCAFFQVVKANLYVASKTWRANQTAARKGDKGVYEILKDIRNILLNNTLSLKILPVEIDMESKLASTKHAVMYIAKYIIKNPSITGG